MKAQKKDKEQVVERLFGLELTVDDSLDKYKGAEFESPKLKKIREKISGPVLITR